MEKTVIYVHGKGGSAAEAQRYRAVFADCRVIGFDYTAQTPWEAEGEFQNYFDALSAGGARVSVIANSIGAFFVMYALHASPIERAYFISPIVDMEKLIGDMMQRAGVSEDELREKREIPAAYGETLSWDYLCAVRAHPIQWTAPTSILYGEKDFLTPCETMSSFARRIGASLTVMKNGEHWFHTPEQLAFLDEWIARESQRCSH